MIKHNKKKNVSIVYEQLMTLAARLVAQKNLKEYNFVMNFIRENFSQNSSIAKERKIVSSLVEGSCNSETVNDLFNECYSQIKSLSVKNLEVEKNRFIRNVLKEFGADIFNIPIKDYKLFASAHVLLMEELNGYKNSTPEERMKFKKVIKENLLKEKVKEEVGNIDNFTYKVLVSKYNKKYADTLNEHQKDLIKSWIKFVVSEEESGLLNKLNEKKNLIQEKIKVSLKNKEHKVSDYYELLKEAQDSLQKKNFNTVNEDNIYEMLKYMDLLEDLSLENIKNG